MAKKIFKGAVSSADTVFGGGLLGGLGLLGGNSGETMTSSSTPSSTAQTAMPTPDSTAIAQAKRRSISAQIARRGRASTILTGDQGGTEKLGS